MYTHLFKLILFFYWSDTASLIASTFANLININFNNHLRTEPILQKENTYTINGHKHETMN